MPFTGASIALIFFLIISGGFLETVDKHASVIIAIAALVGLFSQQAVLKLKDIAGVVLTKPGGGENSIPQESKPVTSDGAPRLPAAAPTVVKIEPDKGPSGGGQEVKITGIGFASVSKVTFGDVFAEVDNFDSTTSTLNLRDTPTRPRGSRGEGHKWR